MEHRVSGFFFDFRRNITPLHKRRFGILLNERGRASCRSYSLSLGLFCPGKGYFSMRRGIINAMKTKTIQIDKAGRVALPKPLLEQFNLLPGDKLRLSVEGNGFRLEPTDAGGELVRKGSVLVFTGGFPAPVTTGQVNDLIERER